MIALEIICGSLALLSALLLVAVLILTFRVHEWRERYNELIDKPFEFWRQREIARVVCARRWDQFDILPSAEIIELHPPAA